MQISDFIYLQSQLDNKPCEEVYKSKDNTHRATTCLVTQFIQLESILTQKWALRSMFDSKELKKSK